MYDLRRARSAAAAYSSAASAAGCRSKYSAGGYGGHHSAAPSSSSSSSYRPSRAYTSRAGYSSYYGHDDDADADVFGGSVF